MGKSFSCQDYSKLVTPATAGVYNIYKHFRQNVSKRTVDTSNCLAEIEICQM